MLKVRLALFVLLLSLFLPQVALSQIQETKEYTVTRGDTLWDISGKELKDPFLWPKIWQENPEIKNPDVLYPGQKIKIPLYLIQKEGEKEELPAAPGKQEPRKEAVKKPKVPVEAKVPPLVEKNLLVSSGYISSSIPSLGWITGSPPGRTLFGNGDVVYVKTDNPVNIGDKFYIIRVGELVRHPRTDKKIGYVAEIVGVAEISKFEYGETEATITQIFSDVLSGDLLDTYYELNRPLIKEPYRKPDLEGVILTARNLRLMNSNHDIVYLDKGSKDGIEVGDLFRTLAVGEHRVPNGFIQIILSQDDTSTAVVRKSTAPIERGNFFVPFEPKD